MNRGKRLLPGDTIGVVAPAGYAAADKIERAVHNLEQLGYRVKLGEGCRNRWYGYAGEDAQRAEEINRFFQDAGVDAILCLRGGYGSLRLLEKIDYQGAAAHPKIFIGYSDITALHLALNQHSSLITFHGPMLASNLADGLDTETKSSLKRAVVNGYDPYEIANPPDAPLKTLFEGSAEGILTGGNLITLASLLGTPFAPDPDGKILFIEEIGEAAYRIDRVLTQLLLAGFFNKVKGVILGDFNDCEPSSPEDMPLEEVFRDRLGCLGIPVLHGLKSGHCRPMMTLPLGARTRIDGERGRIEILEPVVD